MTLPIQPDVENVLRSCAATVRDILMPEIESEWGRYSADLCVASIEYALGLLHADRNAARRAELAAAIEQLRPEVDRALQETEAAGAASEWRAAIAAPSPFAAASALLVAGQNHPGPLCDRVREVLRPVLHRQLDAEMAASMPLFAAFARNMVGR